MLTRHTTEEECPMIDTLTREQIEGILDAIPVELIFIDENERLRYWNKNETRKRKGPEDTLGKDIRGCHKKESMPRVEQIVDDFKSGRGSEAEFWVSFEERVLNRFIAVRDRAGKYLGMIEYLVYFKEWEQLVEDKKDAYKLLP